MRRTNYALLPFLFACVLFIAMHFSLVQISAAATALMWGAGCLSWGAAIGFIFSIPRVVSGRAASEAGVRGAGAELEPDAATQAGINETTAQQLQVNSNLVEISDWLKMYQSCLAYANGSIGGTMYSLIMAVLDRTIVSLLLASSPWSGGPPRGMKAGPISHQSVVTSHFFLTSAPIDERTASRQRAAYNADVPRTVLLALNTARR